ncbi:PPOX class F420-dependent oxidoreductase [Pseudonocardia sp. H11422]|uniref:PPOX class F420-dependent oxidoreductase n=1 Tax=Pseudonocardia sp. H11422 TaxID=2835866 RepID=UPI00292D2DF5|nr:PPOX class F420-dependent oxidoreductase [Pseudonocardia sp. H11422]
MRVVRLDPQTGTIDIGGLDLGHTRKFRNVAAGSDAALVVDDIASMSPWRVRGVEIRGSAEALIGQQPHMPGMSAEVIRIHPRRVISWGLDE